LGSALVALEGIAIGHPEIQSVSGAKVVKGKKLKAVNGSGVSLRQQLTNALHAKLEAGQQDVTRKEVIELLVSVGGNKTSISSFIDSLFKLGVLRRKGKANYKIMPGKE